MRFVLGLLSGALGMLAGWFAIAAAVIGLSGPDRDGGVAMGAFFTIGPLGGLIGFGSGVVLFMKLGLVSGGRWSAAAAGARATARVSRPFAVVVLAAAAGLGWWGWFEFIRSPYLTHGFMTLALQFRLPADAALPAKAKDVQIEVREGPNFALVHVDEEGWHGHDGGRPVILASASLMYKTSHRIVSLSLPGLRSETWRLDLSGDPDPTPGYTPWRLPEGASPDTTEMNFSLGADR